MYYLVYTFLFLFFSIPSIINADKTVFEQNDNLENQATNKTTVTFSKSDPSNTNQSEMTLPTQNAQNFTSQTIEIPATEFNRFLDTVKTNIDLLRDENYEAASSI